MSSSLSYAYFMKPAVGGAAAYLIENILLKQSSKQSAISAVSVAIALSTTPLLTPYLPKDEKTSGMVARALEIGVSTANATARAVKITGLSARWIRNSSSCLRRRWRTGALSRSKRRCATPTDLWARCSVQR